MILVALVGYAGEALVFVGDLKAVEERVEYIMGVTANASYPIPPPPRFI